MPRAWGCLLCPQLLPSYSRVHWILTLEHLAPTQPYLVSTGNLKAIFLHMRLLTSDKVKSECLPQNLFFPSYSRKISLPYLPGQPCKRQGPDCKWQNLSSNWLKKERVGGSCKLTVTGYASPARAGFQKIDLGIGLSKLVARFSSTGFF